MKAFNIMQSAFMADFNCQVSYMLNNSYTENSMNGHYQLIYDLSPLIKATGLSLESIKNTNERKHDLWKDTCFEFFIKWGDEPAYREYNLSLSGAWQCYDFINLKEPRPPQEADVMPPVLSIENGRLKVLLYGRKGSFISPTAVIGHNDQLHYYANQHLDTVPNFHNPLSFLPIFK